ANLGSTANDNEIAAIPAAPAAQGTQLSHVTPVQSAPQPPVEDTRPALDMVETNYKDDGSVVVPDLSGLGLRAAMEKGAECGFVIEADGSGRVTKQVPQPGSAAPPGATVKVVLTR